MFSLGTTLYEALEGVSPFHRDDPAGSLHAVAYEEAPAMRRGGSLEPLIKTLLEKNPANRPSIPKALKMLDAPSSNDENTGTSSQAILQIENQTGTWLGIILDDAYRETVKPDATGTYALETGARKVEVKSDGHTSAPCVLHLKPGATERIAARQRGKDVLVGSQQKPAERPPATPARESKAGAVVGWIAAIAVTLTILWLSR